MSTPNNRNSILETWSNVSKTTPCKTCGKPDWCFFLVEDPEVYGCRRLGDVGSLAKTDKSGEAYYLHLPKGRQPNRAIEDVCKHVPTEVDNTGEPAAPVDERHAAYTAFLAGLSLSEEHRAGLPMATMLELIGYKTAPFELANAAKPIRKLTGPSVKSYLRIPGTRIEESLKGDTIYTVAQHKGYYVPVRNHRGEIEGLRIRKDDTCDGKYTSFRGDRGAGSAPPRKPHVAIAAYAPRYVDRDEGIHTIRLLEGEKKADLATLYTGVLSIGVPSVGSYGLALEGTLDEPGPLHALKVRRIIMPFDADMRQNPAVASASTEAVLKLWEGFEVVGEFWPPEAGKGFDDVWTNGRQDEITSLEGLDLLRKCAELCKSAGVPENPKLAARIRLMEAQGKEDLVLTDDIADALLVMLGTTDGHRFSDEWAERAKETRQSTKLERLLKEAKKRAKEAKKKELVERQEGEAEAAGRPLFERGDNVEVAERLLKDMSEATPLVTDEGKLWQYDPETHVWKETWREHLSQKVKRYAGSVIKGSASGLRINSTRTVIDLATDFAMPEEGPGFFTRRPRGLAFQNTFVRVDGKKLVFEHHRPEHRVRQAYDFNYEPAPKVDPQEEHKAFEFLDLLWEWLAEQPEAEEDDMDPSAAYLRGDTAQRIRYVQEFFGLSLLGLAPKYCGKTLIFLGDGANGKSVMMEIIRSCFPEGTVTEVAPQEWTNDQKVALLAGKWLNVVGELPTKDLQESSRFKAIVTGQEAVPAKNVYERPFLVKGEAGHVALANQLPASGDGTHGFARRNVVLTMSQVYLDHQQDKTLADRILAEEKAQIIRWFLEGAQAALNRGKICSAPESSDRAVAQWMQQSDPVRRWLVQDCVGVADFHSLPEVTYSKRAESLYQDYRVWAQMNGHQAVNSANFSNRLKQSTMALARTPPEGFWVRGDDSLDSVARTGVQRHRNLGRRCPILTRDEWEKVVDPPDDEERKAPVTEVDLNSLN